MVAATTIPELSIRPSKRPLGEGRNVSFLKPYEDGNIASFQLVYIERAWREIHGSITELRWRNNRKG